MEQRKLKIAVQGFAKREELALRPGVFTEDENELLRQVQVEGDWLNQEEAIRFILAARASLALQSPSTRSYPVAPLM